MKKLSMILILFTASCTIAPHVTVSNVGNGNTVSTVVDGKLFATAYQQRAAEYRALCFQAFNIARMRVDEIALTKSNKPKAIITDIDETILDNSDYEAHQTLQGKDYEQASWNEWTSMSKADTVPGAASFLQYAASQGLEIFYVTNRGEQAQVGTLKNIQKFDLPNADNEHLLLRQDNSSKEERRKKIAASHDIVMLLGDNLADFSFLFDKKNNDERRQNVNSVADEFGNRFIIIPNTVYGDWESALYNYNSLTQSQKDSAIKVSLRTY